MFTADRMCAAALALYEEVAEAERPSRLTGAAIER